MTTIALSVSFNDEQTKALDEIVGELNAALDETAPKITRETYLENCALVSVEGRVRQNFAATVAALGKAAEGLSYEKRKALIETVQAEIAK